MYEAQFRLKRRPFAATPDPRCFLSSHQMLAALDELVVCVEQGQGVAIATAPAGTGKTLLCERLRAELESNFEVVFLGHASFLTRRALLQTVLADLNHVYQRHDEQELRLELIPAIRRLSPRKQALVLICDEAHMLTEDLLEELRILSDLSDRGTPLVRLVLVGQPGLEETLTRPTLEALNQRIRSQVCLESFDRAGSFDYIDFRITWAGGRTAEVFTPEALELICHASQGVPRCINQLCDHSLLLGYVAEQAPVSVEMIREALRDLRQLPLHWNESLAGSGNSADVSMTNEPDQSAPAPSVESHSFPDDPATFEAVEFGADATDPDSAAEMNSFDPGEPALDASIDLATTFEPAPAHSPLIASAPTHVAPAVIESVVRAEPMAHQSITPQPLVPQSGNPLPGLCRTMKIAPAPAATIASDQVVEEIVWDRYTAIDGGFPLPEKPKAPPLPPAFSPVAGNQSDTHRFEQVHKPESVSPPIGTYQPASAVTCDDSDAFDTVCARLQELLPETEASVSWESTESTFGFEDSASSVDDQQSLEDDLGKAVSELMDSVREELASREHLPAPIAPASNPPETTIEYVTPAQPCSAAPAQQFSESAAPESSCVEVGCDEDHCEMAPASSTARPYRNLFSQLRRKQQGLL